MENNIDDEEFLKSLDKTRESFLKIIRFLKNNHDAIRNKKNQKLSITRNDSNKALIIYRDIEETRNLLSNALELAYENYEYSINSSKETRDDIVEKEEHQPKVESNPGKKKINIKKSGVNTIQGSLSNLIDMNHTSISDNKKSQGEEEGEGDEDDSFLNASGKNSDTYLREANQSIEKMMLLHEITMNIVPKKFSESYSSTNETKTFFVYDEKKNRLISKNFIRILAEENLKTLDDKYYDIKFSQPILIDQQPHRESEENFFSPWIPILIKETFESDIKVNKVPPSFMFKECKAFCIFELAFLDLKNIDEIETMEILKDKSKYSIKFPYASFKKFKNLYENNDISKKYNAIPFLLMNESLSFQEFFRKLGVSDELISDKVENFDTFSNVINKQTKTLIEEIFKITPCICFRFMPLFLYPNDIERALPNNMITEKISEKEIDEISIKMILKSIYKSPFDIFDINTTKKFIENRIKDREEPLIKKIEKRVVDHNKYKNPLMIKLPWTYINAKDDLKKRISKTKID